MGPEHLQPQIFKTDVHENIEVRFVGNFTFNKTRWPITVAVRSKERNIIAHSKTKTVGSNPTRDTDVYVFFSVFVLPCLGSALATG
jgi:hypothetical protein